MTHLEVYAETLTDEQIQDALNAGLIPPSLASAATRTWATGTGMARRAARWDVANAINLSARRGRS